MCKFFSAIVTKDNIYYDIMIDCHEDLIEKFKLREKTGENINIARIEIYPENSVFDDFKNWIFHVDENIKPDWLDEKECEKKLRKILKNYVSDFIIQNKEIELLENGRFFLKNSKVECLKSGIIDLMISSTVKEMWGSSTVKK